MALDRMLLSATVILCAMLITWLISVIRRDASIVDIVWGCGFVLVAWACWLGGSTSTVNGVASGRVGLCIVWAVTLWGARLAIHLAIRARGHGEDYRYQAMRAKWGRNFAWVSLLTVFGLQGAVMWCVALPIQLSQQLGPERMVLAVAGGLLFSVGLYLEAVADWQLARFRATRRSEQDVLQTGLWRYSRHPNYFGECLVWWGIYALALAHRAPVWTLISPILMTWLLLRVSGVRLLERGLRAQKPEYERYAQRTSAFVPWPPRKG